MTKPLVSICVPVYEMKGQGAKYLKRLLKSVTCQDYDNIEVVISDHSKNDELKEITAGTSLNIVYEKYTEKYNNSPANTNNVLNMANGKYIKILFQDDYLSENSNSKWMFCRCIHCRKDCDSLHRDHNVEWAHNSNDINFNTFKGIKKTLGGPSLLFFEKNELRFDEDLTLLMDYDFYYQLAKNLGEPVVYNDKYLVTVRIWPGSISMSLPKVHTVDRTERKYLDQKYKDEK
jgi:glycosyltransferase involved in cell wall biosynthesis